MSAPCVAATSSGGVAAALRQARRACVKSSRLRAERTSHGAAAPRRPLVSPAPRVPPPRALPPSEAGDAHRREEAATLYGEDRGAAAAAAAFRAGEGADVDDDESAREHQELYQLIGLLPGRLIPRLLDHPRLGDLVEVVMDLGRPPLARFPGGDEVISSEAVTSDDLEGAAAKVGEFGGDNRAGIDGCLHRISAIRNRSGKIVGLTCRVGRAKGGSAALARDLLASGESMLLMGRPGVGKTTAIREICRYLADEKLMRVVVIDTSNEIAGDGDVPHPAIGRSRRLQVSQPELQHQVMIEAVQNHMPEVIVIDEIGTELECMAARTISQRGVTLIATAHGNTLANLVKNPSLVDLVGGINTVTLGDDEARRRGTNKSVLEREAAPVFDVAVEMETCNVWRVHRSVAHSVDQLLNEVQPVVELRQLEGQEVRVELEAMEEPMEEQPPETWVKASKRLKLYAHELPRHELQETIQEIGVAALVEVTLDPLKADAVVALRSRVTRGGHIRQLAQLHGIPVYALKSPSISQMVRVLRRILGMTTTATAAAAAAANTTTAAASDYGGGGLFYDDDGDDEDDGNEDAGDEGYYGGGASSSGGRRRRIERVSRDVSWSFSDSVAFSSRRAPSSASPPPARSVLEDLAAIANLPPEEQAAAEGGDAAEAEGGGAAADGLDVSAHPDVQRMADSVASSGDMRRGTASNRSIEATRLYKRAVAAEQQGMDYEEDEEALIRLYGLDDDAAPAAAPRLRRRKSERQKRKSSSISREEAAARAAQQQQQQQEEEAAGDGAAGAPQELMADELRMVGATAAAIDQQMLADALQEVRMAVETLVLPKGEAVELLARPVAILQAQVRLVEEVYGMQCEVCGSAPNRRMRIVPPSPAAGEDAGGGR